MTFPIFARYEFVMIQVNNLFAKEKIHSFPIDPFQIIKNNKWGLMTYSELAQVHGVTVKDIETAFQSEDGYTIYDGVNHTIAYNDTITVPGRIKFTLMHEIGHIYLDHLIDFDETILARSALTESKYKVLENEANSFARNALAPVVVVKDLKISKINDLVDNFEITPAAAKVRLKTLMLDYKNILSQYIMFQRENFKTFINIWLNSLTCLNCKHLFYIEEAKFCPICSSNKLFKGRAFFQMKYDGYEVDTITGRPVACPRCENEEVHQGEFCKVCGIEVLNKCTNKHIWNGEIEWECGEIADGNARFCVKCGHETTYFANGLLDSWEDEKERKEEQEFDGIPF